jgi:hypothetical protein
LPVQRLRPTRAIFTRVAVLATTALVLSACNDRGDPIAAGITPPPSSGSPTTPAEPGKAPATASVKLSWSAPAQNADGTPLQDLAGYRIYYSQAPWGWTSNLNVQDPATTTIEIPDLATGTTWYFAMTSYNASGVESERTGYVSKML